MRAHFQSGKAQEFLCIRIGVATVAMVVAAFSRAFLTPSRATSADESRRWACWRLQSWRRHRSAANLSGQLRLYQRCNKFDLSRLTVVTSGEILSPIKVDDFFDDFRLLVDHQQSTLLSCNRKKVSSIFHHVSMAESTKRFKSEKNFFRLQVT